MTFDDEKTRSPDEPIAADAPEAISASAETRHDASSTRNDAAPQRAPGSPGGEDPSVAAAPKDDATEDEDDASRPSFVRRHPGWIALGALAVAVVCVAGYVVWSMLFYPYETTDDAFVDARSFTIAPKVSGYVVDVSVTDNQHVAAGATLFRIDPRDYQTALDQAEGQVAAAEAAIANIDAQIEAQKAQIDVAKAQVQSAEAQVKFAQEDASRYKDLASQGYGSVKQAQSTTSTLQQQQSSVAQAEANVVAAEKQVRSLDAQRANAVAQLTVAKAQRDQARLNLGYATLTAAQPGRVVRLTGSKGQYAQGGQGLATFVPDEIWVTANFKESQVTDMRPGQPVDIEIDAYPDHTITGRVDSVQPGSGTAFSLLPAENATGNYVKVVQRIPVKIVVDAWPEDVAIGPGMSIVPTVTVR